MRRRRLILVCGFALGLLLVALLRNAGFVEGALTPYAGYATSLYVLLTIAVAVMLIRNGAELQRLGFARAPNWRHVGLALAAVAFLQITGLALEPVFENLLGTGRDLGRFDDVRGSLPQLLSVLALSWTFAALGEEIAFRIVLLGGLRSLLSDTEAAVIVAVVLQAAIFGFVHLYQGPAGIAGAALSGLVYGAITIMARGAIWPAALAHGVNNTIGLLTLYYGAA